MIVLRGLRRYSALMDGSAGTLYAFDGPAFYQITLQGAIPLGWAERVEGMTISRVCLQDGPPLAILTGALTDQAALSGVLNTVYELHLTIISVHKLPMP